MIRLIALDMDGTTLNENKEISHENKKWIQKATEAGITVIFATGRGMELITPFKEELNLRETPTVALNGSEVWNEKDELLERHLLNSETVAALYALSQEHKTWFWGFTKQSGRVFKENWQKEKLHEDWMKFGIRIDNADVIKHLTTTVKAFDHVEVTSSWWNNLEVNPQGVTKGTGVKRVCDELGITMDDVMAIGDSLNDYPLFCEAGLSIATANAHEKLKEIASDMTTSNQEDGVAHAIQKYVFGLR